SRDGAASARENLRNSARKICVRKDNPASPRRLRAGWRAVAFRARHRQTSRPGLRRKSMDHRGTEKARTDLEKSDWRYRGCALMNWANRLTIGRFFLTLIFVAALSCDFRFNHTLALAVFIVAGVTDYIDGEIARRFSMITDFGKLMDPLIDKVMIAAAFICLMQIGAIPAWATIIIISREFLITGLRLLALSKGQVLAAESLGKHKTAWQIVTVIYFLLLLAIPEFLGATPI